MQNSNFKDTDMQSIIGWVLRGGVIISMSVVIFGAIFYIYRHGHEVADYSRFKGVPDFVHSVSGVVNGVIALKGRAIIQAGIVLLVLTPVIRVVFSAVGFWIEKDYLYVGLTLIVLLVIIVGMITGHGG